MAGTYNSNAIDSSNVTYTGGNITVSTTEQLAASNGSSNNPDRQNILVYNRSTTATIFFGPSGVTPTTGIPIPPQAMVTINAGPNNLIYLIATSGSNTVTIQELG